MSKPKQQAEERLRRAALDLFTSQGYDDTTVSDIATRAGVTSRTYFRYFPDKREVLFGGADELQDRIVEALRNAPVEMPPLAAALHAISTCEDLFQRQGHEHLRRRDTVINSSAELQEREARKLASIVADMADTLAERGTDPDNADLVADLAVIAFKRASRNWIDDSTTTLSDFLSRTVAQARAIIATQPAGTDTPE